MALKTPTAQQQIDGYHDSFINALEVLYKIDKTIALWPFSDPTALESVLLMNLQSLGHLVHQLSRYFNSFWICNDSPTAT